MSREECFIYMTENQCQNFKCSVGSNIKVSIGSSQITGLLREKNDTSSESETIRISKGLSRGLSIPEGLNLNIAPNDKGLKIGPLVGILTSEYNSAKSTFGSQDSFFRKLLTMLHSENGTGYIFMPDNVEWNKKMINGYTLSAFPDGSWISRWFPLPDICYNRHFPRKIGQSSQGIVKRFKQNGIPTFNGRVGTKWAVYKKLMVHPEVKNHLPETAIVHNSSKLESALRRHSNIYVKPINGCKGRGILKIQKKKDGYWLKDSKTTKAKHYSSINEVYRQIRLVSNPKNMIMQPSIRTALPQGHFDLRVMVQKDASNEWSVSGIAARVGRKGQITTNLHTGGHAEAALIMFQKCGFDSERSESILQTVNELAIAIAGILEKTAYPLGELGLDFIIDQNGKVWFLEANPKPSRKSFADMEAHQVRRLTILRPMQFAKSLAGF